MGSKDSIILSFLESYRYNGYWDEPEPPAALMDVSENTAALLKTAFGKPKVYGKKLSYPFYRCAMKLNERVECSMTI